MAQVDWENVFIDPSNRAAIDLLSTHWGSNARYAVNRVLREALQEYFSDEATMEAALTRRRKNIRISLGIDPPEEDWV